MSVPNQTPYNIYTANGLTTVFPYEFYLLNAGDLAVSLNGSVITSGYTISGVGNVDGGEVSFLTPPANGVTVMLERVIPTYRLTDYQDNGDLLADTVNKDFDRLWMAIQQAFIYLGLALTRPLLGGPFNAKGYRIEGLGEPLNKGDAATKRYVDNSRAEGNQYADSLFRRSLRVPEMQIGQLPTVAGRRNKILGFNNAGEAALLLPENGSASDVMLQLAATDGFKNIGQVQSFAALRELAPSADKCRVLLSSWNDGYSVGGGEFEGHLMAADDDGGVIASSGQNWHWRRVKPIESDLTIEHFGGVADGVFNNHDAIVAMYLYARNKNNNGFFKPWIGINLPAGNTFTTPVDLTGYPAEQFILRGPDVQFGYHPTAAITSNMASGSIVFKTSSRSIELANLQFDGRNNATQNTQSFIRNTITGGTFIRVSQQRWLNVGGTVLDFTDTLDTKIEQWYANGCAGDVIKLSWDNAPSWDHVTAVELSNFNAQSCRPGMVFNMPRAIQSIIHNGWIERSNPGNLSNGQWIIDALSLEGCQEYGDLDLTNCRYQSRQLNLVSSRIKRTYNQNTAWVSSFQPGNSVIENFGAGFYGSMQFGYQDSAYIYPNMTSNAIWVNLGKMYLPNDADVFYITLNGQQGFNAPTPGAHDTYSNAAFGRTTIAIQRGANGVVGGTYHSYGRPPVLEVKILKSFGGAVVWARLDTFTRVNMTCETNSNSSITLGWGESGRSYSVVNWQPSMIAADPDANAVSLICRWGVNAGSPGTLGGLGISNDGALEIRSPGVPSGSTVNPDVSKYAPVWLNGELYAIKLFKVN
ncbi:phage tail fiber protein [Serratia marcescens]|uniref:phage tail fiber domain-containing protein n=3 Tax=Serratia marcescens TaxID=615 RepID=UPI00277A9005|nr:phage tail fiber protein [Serratia marcescens]MDP8614759.1 phage tail fiber protein [Serratia marcescens]MDP8644818.1 phage tail fiber protein [Serratia marcescens]MDP8654751.1 phage tail fiber protein [Serratia marcescens]MDP8659714.1 phage tail fiber protein [Serratia marcescens]MDP8718960.1 phage tail fiber protein [Serratia marcescens]